MTADSPEADDRGTALSDGIDRTVEPLLNVRGLEQYYPVRSGIFNRHVGDVKAVDGVDLDVYPGETLAIVGESGCGKSTLAETILRLHEPTSGTVTFRGRRLSGHGRDELEEFRRDVSMIFQDPRASLNDRMTVGSIIAEPMKIHGIAKGHRRERVEELLGEVGLDPYDHYDRLPHELSGGQCQRVGIARALAVEPSLLVADEPVSALDVSIQAQILELLSELQAEYDLTFLFVSHDMSVVRHIADRVAVMYLGRIVELAAVESLFADPQHPYTEALLSSVPSVDAEGSDGRIRLEGSPPDPVDPPTGCNFSSRCPLRAELPASERRQCDEEDPELGEAHVACHFRPE